MGIKPDRPPCVLVLGGSFDPVHSGHVALAKHFIARLKPQELRLLPAGQPWQKQRLMASAAQRVEMLRLAFDGAFDSACELAVTIDQQEIRRAELHQPSYSIDSLSRLREELGKETSIVFLIGADQLQNLSTWKEWRHLFDLAHLCAASRPGFTLDEKSIDPEVTKEWRKRAGSLQEIRNTPSGKTYLEQDLAWDVSATHIRHELRKDPQNRQTTSLMPAKVLDYIQQHHLYR